MKRRIKMKKLILISCVFSFTIIVNAQQKDFPKLTGPYLGQKPPGMMPEIFAPGIVSKEGDQARLFIARDSSEIIYWEREQVNGKMRIISILDKGGVWSEPEVLPFSEEYINMEPCLSPDGKKMFFVSNRPRSGKGEGEKLPDIWMAEKVEGCWREPRNIGDPVNRLDIVVQPFYTVDNKLYFCGENADRSSAGVYVSQYAGNGFSEPQKVDGDISSGQFSGPCVSPDNRMLVLHARKDGERFRRYDLYVSFRDASGKWGELVNLGEAINTEAEEHSATFSPDGRYLFFSRAGDIYWVSAELLKERKPSEPTGAAASFFCLL
jgi:WD40-like Beta Propeller Repeat